MHEKSGTAWAEHSAWLGLTARMLTVGARLARPHACAPLQANHFCFIAPLAPRFGHAEGERRRCGAVEHWEILLLLLFLGCLCGERTPAKREYKASQLRC